MEEKKKHKVMIGIEVILLGMIIAIVGTNAASSNPPSNGVSYSKNSQTTVEGALNDLYTKANYGNASAGQILSGKTALVGGSKITGTMPNYSSNVASEIVPWNGNVYFRMPAGYYNAGQTWGSEVSATNANLASAIGLTAGKLLKGESVLGITGTGETSCPTCESQGYYKVYTFAKSNLDITNDQNIGTSYKPLSYETTSSLRTTKISVTLDKEIHNLVGGYVVLSGDIRVCTSRNSDGSCATTTYPLESRLHSIKDDGTPSFMNGSTSGIRMSIDIFDANFDSIYNGTIISGGRTTCNNNVDCSDVNVTLSGKVLTLEFSNPPCSGTCRSRYEGRNLNLWEVYGSLYYQ